MDLKKNYSIGEYIPSKGLFKVKLQKGSYWTSLGFSLDGNLMLYPEEALYLQKQKNLQIEFRGDILSYTQSSEIVFESIPAKHFYVYTDLKNSGYVVRRHDNNIMKNMKDTKYTAIDNMTISHHTNLEFNLYKEYMKNSNCKENYNKLIKNENRYKEELPDLANYNSLDFFKIRSENNSYIPPNIKPQSFLKNELNTHGKYKGFDCAKTMQSKYCDNVFQMAVLSYHKFKLLHSKSIINLEKICNNWWSYKKLYYDNYQITKSDIIGQVKTKTKKFETKIENDICNKNLMIVIHYDIYKPMKNFSKSNPGEPFYFLHVNDGNPYEPITDHEFCLISNFKFIFKYNPALLIAYLNDENPLYVSINDFMTENIIKENKKYICLYVICENDPLMVT